MDRLDWRLSESRSCATSGTADGVYSGNASCAAQQWVKRQGECQDNSGRECCWRWTAVLLTAAFAAELRAAGGTSTCRRHAQASLHARGEEVIIEKHHGAVLVSTCVQAVDHSQQQDASPSRGFVGKNGNFCSVPPAPGPLGLACARAHAGHRLCRAVQWVACNETAHNSSALTHGCWYFASATRIPHGGVLSETTPNPTQYRVCTCRLPFIQTAPLTSTN